MEKYVVFFVFYCIVAGFWVGGEYCGELHLQDSYKFRQKLDKLSNDVSDFKVISKKESDLQLITVLYNKIKEDIAELKFVAEKIRGKQELINLLNDTEKYLDNFQVSAINSLSEKEYGVVNATHTGKLISSPLESFNVIIENNINIFSNISINIFFIFFFIILFFSYFNNKSIKKNVVLINILVFFFNFFFKNFKNLVTNIRYERYFFLVLTVFIFIVFENLGSFYLLELPFNSHAIITLFLSFILFFNYVISFIINFNETSCKKFIQKDINIFIIYFLFFIELISFFIRPLSLGVRLFANILSGHIPVHIFFTAFIFAFKYMF